MILILSTEIDIPTSTVIDWLIYLNEPFDRINYEDILFFDIDLSTKGTFITLSNDKIYDLSKYKTYWYRRGDFLFDTKPLNGTNLTINKINEYKFRNSEDIKSFVHDYLFANLRSINSYHDNNINKLNELTIAKKNGLLIPHTLITTNKISALKFIDEYGAIIIKPIKGGLNITLDDTNFYTHTLLLNRKEIEDFPETFDSIKLQACIDKAFELRVFYINGMFFASAIFSQNDEKTKIDFRNYNVEKPNRVVPYEIPKKIKIKLIKVMKELKLASGSFDIIVTKSNEYVFLEVNPIGQFSQVSIPCNYFIEKRLAEILTR